MQINFITVATKNSVLIAIIIKAIAYIIMNFFDTSRKVLWPALEKASNENKRVYK